MLPIYLIVLAGALGAFMKDIVEDGKIKIPQKINGYLSLGFLGSVVIGAAVGYIVDGSFLTAFMAGYVSMSIEEAVMRTKKIEI